MGEKVTGKFRHKLEVGQAISIRVKSKGEFAATVTKISADKVSLKATSPPALKKGEQVRIKYLDQGVVAYYWDAEVVKVSGPENEEIAISICGEGMTVQEE
ncbi:hypothetical protein MYX82_07700 [Acidobacteria bacterium AH-259-D05]|nr:hypothetical protein [Acidobacteria bacterium AH-259-D05]